MTTDSPLEIMPMRAEHVPAVLAIHRRAFAGYPHVALGDSYLRRMLSWYADDPTGIALVAILDGQIAGYAFGTDRAGASEAAAHVRSAAVVGLLKHPALVFRRDNLAAIQRRLSPKWSAWRSDLPPNTVSLVGIGVASDHRRRGAAGSLLRRFEEEAGRLGTECLTLSVMRDNVAARHLYDVSGWQMRDTADAAVLTYVKDLSGQHRELSSP